MPFYIYERTETNANLVFRKKQYLSAIPRRIIQPKLDDISKNNPTLTECKWNLDSDEIEQLLQVFVKRTESNASFVLVIDLKPTSSRKEGSMKISRYRS